MFALRVSVNATPAELGALNLSLALSRAVAAAAGLQPYAAEITDAVQNYAPPPSPPRPPPPPSAPPPPSPPPPAGRRLLRRRLASAARDITNAPGEAALAASARRELLAFQGAGSTVTLAVTLTAADAFADHASVARAAEGRYASLSQLTASSLQPLVDAETADGPSLLVFAVEFLSFPPPPSPAPPPVSTQGVGKDANPEYQSPRVRVDTATAFAAAVVVLCCCCVTCSFLLLAMRARQKGMTVCGFSFFTEKERNAAAAIIQARVRGWLARRAYARMRGQLKAQADERRREDERRSQWVMSEDQGPRSGWPWTWSWPWDSAGSAPPKPELTPPEAPPRPTFRLAL